MFQPNPKLEMLMSREKLMENIVGIIEDYFETQITECGELGEISNFEEARDCLTKELCDAVCKNFPAE